MAVLITLSVIMSAKNSVVNIIGGGLAGVEAAWYLSNRGIKVRLFERRLIEYSRSKAHHTSKLAELVCSSSLKSSQLNNASGILKLELKLLDSLVMQAAEFAQIPADRSLAVDRDVFSDFIEQKISNNPLIEIVAEEVTTIKDGINIVATGPLTDGDFLDNLQVFTGQHLHFFDASAPLIEVDSINLAIAFKKNRYGESDGDYLNCPLTYDQYKKFYQELISAKTVVDTIGGNFFSACQPIEVVAKTGAKTLLFGALKPKGLTQDKNIVGVVQLRQDNVASSLYSLVGFQTNLTYAEQKRVFCLIPGLESASFVRYGLMHRNTYINSPLLLNNTLNLKQQENIFIAGQLTGVEGYLESAVTGIVAAINAYCLIRNKPLLTLPITTITGGLIRYITSCNPKHFQPINANFSIVDVDKNEKDTYYLKVEETLKEWIKEHEIFK